MSSPKLITIKNDTRHDEIIVCAWEDYKRRISDTQFYNPTKGPVNLKNADTVDFRATDYIYIDILVPKNAEDNLGSIVKDQGIILNLDYDDHPHEGDHPHEEDHGHNHDGEYEYNPKSSICYDFIVKSSEVKLCKIDNALHRRYSFYLIRIKDCGATELDHHISGNVGHPGGGG